MAAAASPVLLPQSSGGPGGAVAGPLYSGVFMTLDCSLIPEENRRDTPSQRDGLPPHTETELRILGCELIQSAGILLRLPQVAMATGQVLFQRFFYSKSFIKHNFEVVAMACMNLASKIEESPRRVRDVINVFHHLKQRGGKRSSPLILDHNYINTKNQVIKAERRVLKELGFCVHIKHPHKMIVMYLQVLECEKNQVLVQTAWNYMNDALRTDVFVRFEPETIACACIYLAARTLQIPLPSEPHWFLLFGASEVEVREVCSSTLQLYIREKPSLEALETEVETLRARLEEEKLMKRSGGVTPALSLISTFSPAKLSSPRELKEEEENKKLQSEKKENQEQHSTNSSTNKENRVMHNGHTTSRRRPTSHSPCTRSRSGSSSLSSVSSPRQRRLGSPRERRKPSRHGDRRRRSQSQGDSRDRSRNGTRRYRDPRRSRDRSGSRCRRR